jgi:MinD-like ATPase involved in chromosome partitioning or flagellar assembly
MLPARRQAPTRGWQRGVYRLTFGKVNPGLSRSEQSERELVARAKAPIRGYRHVVVLSLKGGPGKTTTAIMLGHTFAIHRGDRVVAVDASPDAGTLGYRVRRETSSSVKDLLEAAEKVERQADVRAYTSQAPSRLEVLASDTDAAMSKPFDDQDYRTVAAVLARFYNLIITDCGPGLLHPAMQPILQLADQVVVVTSPTVDGGRSGSLTLDWLDAHGHTELVRSAVVVINSVQRDTLVNVVNFEDHFGQRCRAVLRVPWDPHLGAGAETSLEELQPATRRAYLELAAIVADRFER